MNKAYRALAAAAAGLGFFGVAFGAFAAHGIDAPQAKAWIQTGAQYQMVHALAALIALLMPRPAPAAAAAFIAGAAIFGGSLYALALGGPRMMGAVAPVGGLAFLAGWLLLAMAAIRQPK